jgi:hypothetical protein
MNECWLTLYAVVFRWVKQFLEYQLPERPLLPHGGLDILMNYFKNMDDEGRFESTVSEP